MASGDVTDDLGNTSGTKPAAIVASATIGIMPGFSLLTDVGLYDIDLPGSDSNFAGIVAVNVLF